jgi:hypothetical protein
MVICTFHKQGRCTRGDSCSFEHIQSPSPAPGLTFRPDAPTFQPSPQSFGVSNNKSKATEVQACHFFQKGLCKNGASCKFKHEGLSAINNASHLSGVESKLPICSFFLRGVCKYGDECRFSHETDGSTTSPEKRTTESSTVVLPPPGLSSLPGLSTSIWSSVTPNTTLRGNIKLSARTISGASVTFKDGAEVSALSLPSDFSAVQMSGLSSDQTTHSVSEFLASKGITGITLAAIRIKNIPQIVQQVAEIKVENPDFARTFLERTGPKLEMNGNSVRVIPLQVDTQTDSSANRLQLNSVSCTWYQPSKVAYLHYGKKDLALKAAEKLNKKEWGKIRHRKLQIKYEPPKWQPIHRHHRTIYTVRVGNLDVDTTEAEITALLAHPDPYEIDFGPPTYNLSSKEAEERVKSLLEAKGTLSEWIVSTDSNGSRVKAIAKFIHADDARRAVQELNEYNIEASGNSKLLVAPIVSVKLSVSGRVLTAVKIDLDILRDKAWKTKYVHIKSYDAVASHGFQNLNTTLRIYGEDRDAVAQTKSSVEKILAGTVAAVQDKQIQDLFFFQPDGLKFLELLMDRYKVFIYRDMRRCILRLYGVPTAILEAQNALTDKVKELATQIHTIVLDDENLEAALKGGFRRLVAELGKDAVKMDITGNPKVITVRGSAKALEQAKEALHNSSQISLETGMAALRTEDELEETCPVCWTEPDEPFKTSCGHTYCLSCLASQCSSASDATLPLRCLGASATCNHLLSLAELHGGLPAAVFETLLETSFTSYVRSRPDNFQYCPTPDCDRVYKTTSITNPRIFQCDSCITPICTGCHVTAHDGLTCEAYKLLARGDDAFSKWKKDNDVRDCPKCGTAIEKTEGCNHMHCKGCGTHICWFCMKTFESGLETYDHMRNMHERIGLYGG